MSRHTSPEMEGSARGERLPMKSGRTCTSSVRREKCERDFFFAKDVRDFSISA